MDWSWVGRVGIVVLCLGFLPLATIWALNTLFGLAIAYTFKTWLAALVLAAVVPMRRSL
jgi:hypothetical protein